MQTTTTKLEASIVTTNRDALRQAWSKERTDARDARARGDVAAEWRHLERAHILSQPMAGPHVRTHWDMFVYGVRHHDRREILGQLVRIVVAAPGSWTGKYPIGNTGAASVSALEPMAIPDDLRAILEGRPSTEEN